VVARVWGYRKIWLQSNRVFETGSFSLPPLEYDTRGFFIDLPLQIQRAVRARAWSVRGVVVGWDGWI
jgi:hypothetical protein